MLTWNKGIEVLKPLPHSGVSKHIEQLPAQTLRDCRGVVELLHGGHGR